MKELQRWLQLRWTWFLIVSLVIVSILSAPLPPGLSRSGMEALALLAAVAILFIAEPISAPGVILFIAVYQVFMGLGTPSQVARSFMHDAVFFIMGALMIGVALTSQQIGKRFILFLIDKVGNNTTRISTVIITACALLAGFIADHVIAAVMTPMVLSLIKTTKEETNKTVSNLSKLLLFSVAYGASIGGLYAPSGGGRNVIIMGFLDNIYGLQIGYGEWIMYAFPITLIMIPITAFTLSRTFKPEVPNLAKAAAGLHQELQETEVTGETITTVVIFGLIVTMWITVGNALGLGTIALFGAILYLMLEIVEWEDYHERVNWGVILIYMGALSLGSLLERTGAAGWIAQSMFGFVRESLHLEGIFPIAATTSFLSTTMTNLMSAGATASVIGPITLKLANFASINPLTMGLLTAISCAFGYLLLLATPPNAIIYSTGYVKPKDFLKAGVWLTFASFGVLFLVAFFWWRPLGLF